MLALNESYVYQPSYNEIYISQIPISITKIKPNLFSLLSGKHNIHTLRGSKYITANTSANK